MALEGSLQDMSLTDLFQVFRMGPKTGILMLSSSADRGVVYVADGRLVDAVYVHGAERQVIAIGEDAVIHLLQWDDASFTFRHDPAVRGRQPRIFHDSDWLILEGMRRRELPRRALQQPITMATRLALALLPGTIESGVNLSLDQWRILSQIAVCQNLGEICQNAGISAEAAIRTVTELVEIGLLEILSAPPIVSRRQNTATYPQESFRQVLAGVGTLSQGVAAPTPGRLLLHAIKRRIHSL